MKTALALAVALSAAALSTSARADDKAACLDAAARGQTLRDAHQLVEAREQFQICARVECPAVVQTDCAAWLDAAEKSLPSVVLTAKDRAGGDLVDVKVLVDGHPLVTALDGRAMPMNPGAHTFRFERADGSVAEQQVLVKEGERARLVAVVLGAEPVVGRAVDTDRGHREQRPSGVRTAGWVIGGLGVVGLVVGAAAGAAATADKGKAMCVVTTCANFASVGSAKTAAKVADAGLIGGGVLAAAGVTLVLVGRSGKREAAVRVAPLVGVASAGIGIGGSW